MLSNNSDGEAASIVDLWKAQGGPPIPSLTLPPIEVKQEKDYINEAEYCIKEEEDYAKEEEDYIKEELDYNREAENDIKIETEKQSDLVARNYEEKSGISLLGINSNSTSSPETEIDYSGSQDETDWDESDLENSLARDSFDLTGGKISGHDDKGTTVVKPVLTQVKQDLIDRLTEEFWIIFNQDWAGNIRKRGATAGSATTFASPSASYSRSPEKSSSGLSTGKRPREDDDNQRPNDRDREGPKRRRDFLSPSDSTENSLKFSCPYRKHDPRKYCVQNWGPCALTPQRTVARVKGHLYRYHLVYQCQRCKDLFDSEEELDSHIEAVEGCKVKASVEHIEGITSKGKERLQSRKKAYPGQSEADRWRDMYKILFPHEEVPTPYFEPVQDGRDRSTSSPNSQGIADFEQYLRRELPRIFRNALERTVEGEMNGRIMDLFDEAKGQAFSSYRTMLDPNSFVPSASDPPNIDMAAPLAAMSRNQSLEVLETFYQHPPVVSEPVPESFALPQPKFGSKDAQKQSLESGYVSNVSSNSSVEHAAPAGKERNISMASGSPSQSADDRVISDMGKQESSTAAFSDAYDPPMPSHRGDTNALAGYLEDIWSNNDVGDIDWLNFDTQAGRNEGFRQ